MRGRRFARASRDVLNGLRILRLPGILLERQRMYESGGSSIVGMEEVQNRRTESENREKHAEEKKLCHILPHLYLKNIENWPIISDSRRTSVEKRFRSIIFLIYAFCSLQRA
jgi:hypothetical protein